ALPADRERGTCPSSQAWTVSRRQRSSWVSAAESRAMLRCEPRLEAGLRFSWLPPPPEIKGEGKAHNGQGRRYAETDARRAARARGPKEGQGRAGAGQAHADAAQGAHPPPDRNRRPGREGGH